MFSFPGRHKIGRRLAAWIGVCSVLLALVFFAILIPLERRAVENTAATPARLLAQSVAATYRVVDENSASHLSEDLIAEVAAAPGVSFVEVLDHRGIVRRGSDRDQIGRRRKFEDTLKVDHENELILTQPIAWNKKCQACHDSSQDPVGAARVGISRAAAVDSIERFHIFGAAGILLTIVILILVIIALTERMITRPVFALARLMQKAEQGDFLVRAHVESQDEVGTLAKAFNRMLRAITAMKAAEIEREADLANAQRELTHKVQVESIAAELQETNTALEKRVVAQELLMDVAHRLGSTLEQDALLDRLVLMLVQKMAWKDFAIYLVHTDEDGEVVLRLEKASGRMDREDLRAKAHRIGVGLAGWVAETGAPKIEEGKLAIPLLHKGRVLGVIELLQSDEEEIDDEMVELLVAVGAQTAMAVVNAELYQRTLELSVTDPLTQLMNRRALERLMEAEVIRAQRFGTQLAVLMLDLDHFKQYNDRMGHLLGDEALVAAAEVLRESVRKVDAVARFGGEEFCVILPQTDEAAAIEVAEKLRTGFHGLNVPGASGQPLGRISISVGVAIFPDDMPPAPASMTQALLDAADKGAYHAKAHGRDQVVSARIALNLPEKPALEPLELVPNTLSEPVESD